LLLRRYCAEANLEEVFNSVSLIAGSTSRLR
jgi:hypothetical protein